MIQPADLIIIAVRYDETNERITHVKSYTRNGELLVDLKEATRAGLTNAIETGKVCVTAIKNPLTGLWEKHSSIEISNGYIKASSNVLNKDYLENIPHF